MKKVLVSDKMQKNYVYYLKEPVWENFDPEFLPQLTPQEMLELGVFGWKYINDCQNEFPESRFQNAKVSIQKHNPKINFFGVRASMPLSYWREKWRIYEEDPRWWFQRYCRYFMGRRIPKEDARQIKRRKAFKRHFIAVQKWCYPYDRDCRKKQRQALLHRAYDSRQI